MKKQLEETRKRLHKDLDKALDGGKFLIFIVDGDKKGTKNELVSTGFSKLETLGLATVAHKNIMDQVEQLEVRQMMSEMSKAMDASIKKAKKKSKKTKK